MVGQLKFKQYVVDQNIFNIQIKMDIIFEFITLGFTLTAVI